jgi:hypothetical protein
MKEISQLINSLKCDIEEEKVVISENNLSLQNYKFNLVRGSSSKEED